MGATIQKAYPDAEVSIVPGERGNFVVKADGVELWNKRRTGRFPQHEEILEELLGKRELADSID